MYPNNSEACLNEHDNDDSVIQVLLIEDDQRLARLTADYLCMRGLLVTVEGTGPSGLAEVMRYRYDVVLLDLMLPGMGGHDVCQRIREVSDVPIIMVTALDDEGDRIMGLEQGADDYICKPFSSPELLARIRALVRRSRGRAGPSNRPLRVGRMKIDPSRFLATLDDRPLDLTAYEFAILRVMSERAGRVLSREQILDLAKGSAEQAFDRSIDGHISRLRRKLGDDSRRPRWLKTIRGVGYLLVPDEEW